VVGEPRHNTYAYDQRGFGKAPHTGIWPGGKALREDLVDCVEAVRERNPGVPVFALGESMGGAVVLSALADPARRAWTASSWWRPPCGRAKTCRFPIA